MAIYARLGPSLREARFAAPAKRAKPPATTGTREHHAHTVANRPRWLFVSSMAHTDARACSPYRAIIRRLVPDLDPAGIEDQLRRTHGSIDAIAPVHFAREVKRAADHLRQT
jgi:hypothetical protein